MTTVAFGLVSAGYREDTIAQLVAALAPYPVLIHHDFSRAPEFRFQMPNGYLVPDARPTGWGDWDFVSGILRTVRYGLENFEFDYLQLLSPTCLPIRQVDEFVEHLANTNADAYCEPISLDEDADAQVSYAHRVYFAQGTIRQRAVCRAMTIARGTDYRLDYQSGLAIARPPIAQKQRVLTNRAGIALARAIDRGLFGRHLFSSRFRPFMGSTWICANRSVLQYLLAQALDDRIHKHFSKCKLIDECFIASVIGNSNFQLAPINTFVNDFDRHGHPKVLTLADEPRLRGNGKFFARKFNDDPSDPLRQAVLRDLSSPSIDAGIEPTREFQAGQPNHVQKVAVET